MRTYYIAFRSSKEISRKGVRTDRIDGKTDWQYIRRHMKSLYTDFVQKDF